MHLPNHRARLFVVQPYKAWLIRGVLFRSSTNLDSWSSTQLRRMKMGGNAFATEFFKKNGGSNLLTLQDGKQKYTSRVAGLYKEELERRIAEDEKRCAPGRPDL